MNFFKALFIFFCSWLILDIYCTEIPPKTTSPSEPSRRLSVYERKYAEVGYHRAFDVEILKDYEIRKKICSIKEGFEYAILDYVALNAASYYQSSGYFEIDIEVEQEHAEDLFRLLVHQYEICKILSFLLV